VRHSSSRSPALWASMRPLTRSTAVPPRFRTLTIRRSSRNSLVLFLGSATGFEHHQRDVPEWRARMVRNHAHRPMDDVEPEAALALPDFGVLEVGLLPVIGRKRLAMIPK